MDDASYFLADALAEILLRFPPSSRRRLRLVCRHWRDVIDDRAPERRSRPKPLAFESDTNSAAAYVIDDLPGGPCRVLWTDGVTPGTNRPPFRTEMVGTCNGLLCLYDEINRAIFLANPITGEKLVPPQLPGSRHQTRCPRHPAYSFGFLPTRGQHKIVHIPCYPDLDYQSRQFSDVQVLTLGDAASWRDVPAPPRSTCRLVCGIIVVDGTVHWVTNDTTGGRLTSFDLTEERFTPTMSLPVKAGPEYLYSTSLTEVRGRLGIITTFNDRIPREAEVWVLSDRGKHEWSLRYRVVVHGAHQQLSQPRFVHGDYMLSNGYNDRDYDKEAIFRHTLSGDGKLPCHGVRISERKPGTEVASFKGSMPRRIFAYVETMEPLSFYRLGD